MKFIRLPAHHNGIPQTWFVTGAGSEHTVFLLPGDALLTETVACPAAVKTRRQMRQWLKANPALCQWDPQKERLLYVSCRGDKLSYWAVAHEMWQCWQQWLRNGRVRSYVLPDWMLLPPPAGGKFFVLQADDTILFRHDEETGGAIAAEQRALVESMAPRWLALPGSGGDYSLSTAFLSRQVVRGSRWRTARPVIPVGKSLSVLLLIVSALLVEQGAEFIWLNETHTSVRSEQPQEMSPAKEPQGYTQSMRWLQEIQQNGPIQLRGLTILPEGVTFGLRTPLSCEEMQTRLKALPLQGSYDNPGSGCEFTLRGGPF